MTRPPAYRLAALALLALSISARSQAQPANQVLWQIGTHDGSYREFAIAGRYADYKRAFPHDVTFSVGRSSAAKDWPYIGPGPSDPWAGSTKHPFRIDFDLAAVPRTACRLDVCLVDARHEAPQVLEVDISGRRTYAFDVAPGAVEESLTDPAAGRQSTIAVPFAPSLLHAGRNRITLTVSRASWVLYDSVSLLTGPGIPIGPVLTDATATLVSGANGAANAIALQILNVGAEGSLAASLVGGPSLSGTAHVEPGQNTLTFPLESNAGTPPYRLLVTSAGRRLTVPVQAPSVVWRIGQPDGDYREFAIAGRYPDYVASFPSDVTYHVGTDLPERAWPFIHPGPNDAWAGTRRHPFRIEFPLASAPTSSARLNLDVVDTQPLGGPTLEVDINGRARYRVQLPAGGNDASLADPSRGHHLKRVIAIAANLLRAGSNAITFTIVDGSWLTYDAVSLETGVGLPDGPRIEATAAIATPLFRRVDGRLRQMVRVSVRNTGVRGDVQVSVQGVNAPRRTVSVAPGENTVDLLAKPLAKPTPAIAVVRSGARECEARFVALPERRWKVFVGPSTHTDIGYTDWQERVYARHNDNTATALEACTASPGFKWNLEVGYQADLFRTRGAQAYQALLARIQEGRIGIGGLYLNMLTGLCSGEELVRTATFVQDVAREAGGKALAANLTDVPTAVGTLPMILAQAGVRYFADGANDYIPFNGGGRQIDQSPYWWEGHDGSRVLAITARQYAQASTLGMLYDVPTMEQRLPGWLRQIGRDGYPGDAAYVYGAFPDNQPMSPHYSEVAAAWNARWEYPRIVVGRMDEFFRYVEAHFGSRLPTFRGDIGVKWEDGAASSALETAMVRRAKARLDAADRWHALAGLSDPTAAYPADDLKRAWQQVLLYDEHTWGAASSVTDPEGEQTRHQWAVKAEFAHAAARQADELLRSGLDQLARQPTAGWAPAPVPAGSADARTVVVMNEHSWPRDIVVTCPTPSGSAGATVTETGGAHLAVLSQVEGSKVVFLARRVPPMGWRSYLVQGAAVVTDAHFLTRGADEWSWQTPDFRLRVDSATGALSSLRDKKQGTEWVRRGAGYGINQFLYVLNASAADQAPSTPSMKVITHTNASVAIERNGPLRAILHIARTGPSAPPMDTYLVLGPGRRIEFVNVLHKTPTLSKEAGYFVFPFPVSLPAAGHAFVEQPYGVMEVERDQAPGGCRDWFATNSFAAVSDGRHTALLATPHAPMLTVNDILRGRHQEHIRTINGSLFAYAFNNCWDTNYKASQGGDMLFAFTLDLRDGAFDPASATRFGWEALSAMSDPAAVEAGDRSAASQVEAMPAAEGVAPEGSLLHLSGDAVLVGGITRRGEALQVRLYNPSSHAAAATLTLPGRRLASATTANLNGMPTARLPIAAGGASVRAEVRARSLITVLLEMGGP